MLFTKRRLTESVPNVAFGGGPAVTDLEHGWAPPALRYSSQAATSLSCCCARAGCQILRTRCSQTLTCRGAGASRIDEDEVIVVYVGIDHHAAGRTWTKDRRISFLAALITDGTVFQYTAAEVASGCAFT